MLLIRCPWCGEREETEFHYGGEAHKLRPLKAEELSDREWAEFLFLNHNPKGVYLERWSHAQGCRRWFNVVRDTVTSEIIEVYPMGSLPTSPEGKTAYEGNWRRATAAEANAKGEAASSEGDGA